MKLFIPCLHKYSNTYGILMLLSYAFFAFVATLLVATSSVLGIIIFLLGFILLLVAQFVLQSPVVNVALGSFGIFTAIGFLIVCIISFQPGTPIIQQTNVLEPLGFFLLFAVASSVVAFSVFFRRSSDDITQEDESCAREIRSSI